MEQYSTNLTDKQWQVIEKIINPQERKRKYSLRNIMNAILYLLKTGCQWRMIPKDFAPWESVYYYFSKWKNEGVIEDLWITSVHKFAQSPVVRRAPVLASLIPVVSRHLTMWILTEGLMETRRLRAENSIL